MKEFDAVVDVVVIGGGPSGAAIGRLLATWGHSVRILAKPCDRARGLGESLPPSTKKLLDAIGVLDAVDGAGFYKTTGNTVWWASRERRVETFDPSGQVHGYQVFRPDLDRVLLDSAAAAGAEVCEATARRVEFAREEIPSSVGRPLHPATSSGCPEPVEGPGRQRGPERPARHVEYERDGVRETIPCRFVIDCSGRAGVVAKAYRRAEPTHRMYALVGVWNWSAAPRRSAPESHASEDRSALPDESHTVVETYADGWAWSVPISETTRHVGTMVDGTSPRVTSGRVLVDAYRGEIGKTIELARMLEEATLQHAFACDASLYSSETYAGPGFLLVGDAGSFIDPLSSFGVKKALASAWVGAVVVHTCLMHPDRQAVAFDFFTDWERDVYRTHLARSRDFARAALAKHPHRFWAARAQADIAGPATPDEADLLRDPAVQAAFDAFKRSEDVALTLTETVRFIPQPVIRGRQIVVEDAIPEIGRFFRNIDLVALAELSREHARVPDLFEAYCRRHAPVPLPSVLGGLSLLVAKGILKLRV